MNSTAWSAIISGIALFSAILSPILTTIINNHYQIKKHKQKYFEAHRSEVIENYMRYAGSINRMASNSEDFRQYGRYSKEVYLYLPENLWHFIDEIDSFIITYDYDNASKILSQFCKELNKYHPRSVKYSRYQKRK